MNKIPLIAFIKELKERKINELKEIRRKEMEKVKREYVSSIYYQNKTFILSLLTIDAPVIADKNGLKLSGPLAGVVDNLRSLKHDLDKIEDSSEKDKKIIDILADYVYISYYAELNSKPYLEFDKNKEKIEEEFNKLLGNLKLLNGKKGSAYCRELGIELPDEKTKNGNPILAPIDIALIK